MLERLTLALRQGDETAHEKCEWAWGIEDHSEMLTAWQSALVYFLTDYRFLYE